MYFPGKVQQCLFLLLLLFTKINVDGCFKVWQHPVRDQIKQGKRWLIWKELFSPLCEHVAVSLHLSCFNTMHLQTVYISNIRVFSVQFICFHQNCIACDFPATFFLLQGWFSVVRQHCWGKPCRLITLDSHKLNANGLRIHIKVPDGCERWQQTRAWFACHSVTFALFTFLINAERHIYQMTGRDGRWEGEKKSNSHPWGVEREKMGSMRIKKWFIMKAKMGRWRKKTSSYRGLTCHVNKRKWGHGRKKSTTVTTQDWLH